MLSATDVRNLTPHVINVCDEQGEVLEAYPPMETSARVKVATEEAASMDGFPAVRNTYGAVEGLPEPVPNRVYLVSLIVLGQCAGRTDVYAPDTGPQSVLREENGNIRGVRRFVAAPL